MLSINNKNWNIAFVEPRNSMLMNSDGVYTLGVTDKNTETIYINNRLSDYMRKKVLIHELCHAYAMSYDYEMEIETEEIVADFISLFGDDILQMADKVIREVMRYVL